MRCLLIGIAASVLVLTPACAGDAQVQEDGAVSWDAGIDGISIEWNPDGSVRRISSRFVVPVEFPDRRGLSNAYVIAEEKAKAAIIRYLKQDVADARVIAEITTDINEATRSRGTAGSSITKTDQRTFMSSLTEITSSFASGTLRGVIILEKGYDEKKEEAWVVVGISDKTTKAAEGVGSLVRGETSQQDGNVNLQKSETQRLKKSDW